MLARLERKTIELAQRERALHELAKLHKTDREAELVAALQRLDEKGGASATAAEDLGKLLGTTPAKDLVKSRAALAALGQNARQDSVRRAAWAALVIADDKPEVTWADAKSAAARQSLIEAISFIPDPTARAKFQPLLATVLGGSRDDGRSAFRSLERAALDGIGECQSELRDDRRLSPPGA